MNAARTERYRIPQTCDLVVSARTLVDKLPTQQIINNVRHAVENGQQAIPGVRAVTCTVYRGNYHAAVVFADGTSHGVTFNVLEPRETARGYR